MFLIKEIEGYIFREQDVADEQEEIQESESPLNKEGNADELSSYFLY